MAITTFTGDLSAQFAAGTSLEARPASNWPAAKRPPEAGTTPVGSATATAASNSAGVLSLTGLADSTEYYVRDAAGTRYVRVTTFPERQELMTSDVGVDVPAVANLSVNVKDYGARGDGISETGAAFRSAYAAAVLLGRDVFIPAGTYYINDPTFQSVIQLARDNAGTAPRVRIYGEAGTVIKLSALTPRFLDFNKIADYDVFRNVTVERLKIDANNIGGKHHVVIGTDQAGVQQYRLSFQDIVLQDIEAYNIVTNATSDAVDRRRGVWLVSYYSAFADTATVVERIRCTRVKLLGGEVGIYCAGQTDSGVAGAGTQQWVNDIVLESCHHDTVTQLTAAPSGGGLNFQIGGDGYGGKCRISNCYGKGSGDVGIEVDNMHDAIVENNRIYDSLGNSFHITNFNYPALEGSGAPGAGNNTLATQRILLDKNRAERSGSAYPATIAAGASGYRFPQNRSLSLGNVIVRDCSYYRSVAHNSLRTAGEAIFLDCPSSSFKVDGFRSVITGLDIAAGSTTGSPSHIYVGTGIHANDVFKNITLRTSGNVQAGGSDMQPRMFEIAGAVTEPRLTIEDLGIDYNYTSSGANQTVYGLLLSGGTIDGIIDRFKVLGWATIGGSPGTSGIELTSGCAIGTRLVIRDSECAGTGLSPSNGIVVNAANKPKVHLYQNRYSTTYPRASAAMGAANFAAATFTTATGNQYIGGDPAEIHFANGTGAAITKIEASKDGTTYEEVWTQASGVMAQDVLVPVDNGDYIKVTFATTQPTTRVRPRR